MTPDVEHTAPPAGFPDGGELLARNAVNLLGPRPEDRSARIMVTLPGRSCNGRVPRPRHGGARDGSGPINCAHDGPQAWRDMVGHVRAAEEATGKRGLIAMDLAGPKLRTGPVRPGPRVLRVKPVRSSTGTVLEPGRVWLGEAPEPTPGRTPAPAHGPALPAIPLDDNAWAGSRKRGQKIKLDDARGARRTLVIEQTAPHGCLVTLDKTVYFAPGTRLTAVPEPAAGKKGHQPGRPSAKVGDLPAVQESLLIHRGDSIVLSRNLEPADSTSVGKHRIGCTLAGVLADVRTGERIWFDDGKIGGVITAAGTGRAPGQDHVRRAAGYAAPRRKRHQPPGLATHRPALTEQDLADLEHVRELADIVSMSFVRSAADVRELLAHLDPGGIGTWIFCSRLRPWRLSRPCPTSCWN